MLRRRLALLILLLLTAGALAFSFFGPQPSNDRDWTPDQALLPWVEFSGRRVTVHNVRDFRYRSVADYDAAWEDRSYDLDRLRSAWFLVEPFERDRVGPAHTLMSFGFEGDDYLAISAEIRKERGEEFSPWKGLLRQYEIMYIVGDERDLIQLRTNHRRDPNRCRACVEVLKRIFESYPVLVPRLAQAAQYETVRPERG